MPDLAPPALDELIDTEAPMEPPALGELQDTSDPLHHPDVSTLQDTEAPSSGAKAVKAPPSNFLASFKAAAAQTTLNAVAAVADLVPSGVGLKGAPLNPEDKPKYDALKTEWNDIQDAEARSSEGGGGVPNPRLSVVADELKRLENKPASQTMAGHLRDAASQSFEFYGADPASQNKAAQLGRGAGAFLSTLPTASFSLPAAVAQLAGTTYEASYSAKEKELKDAGNKDDLAIASEAEKAASVAAIKAVPELSAYLAGGKLATSAVRLLPIKSALVRGSVGAALGTAGNVAAGGTIRAIKGEEFLPNVEQLTQDVLWGLVHGKGEFSATRQAQSMMDGTHPAAAQLAMIATDRMSTPSERAAAESGLDKMRAQAAAVLGRGVSSFDEKTKAKADELRTAGLPATADAIEQRAETLLTQLANEATKTPQQQRPPASQAGSAETTHGGIGETSQSSVHPQIDYSPFDTAGGLPNEAALDSGAVEPTDPTTTKLRDFPIYEQPISELTLSADVPNFKSDADPLTGVVEGQQLEGKYERLGTGAVTVWERLNGKREVVSGRHRFDLAKRAGEETIPSQLIREADGWTQQRVARLDAEANIRDGQGSIRDYANYFKNSEGSEADAAASGLLSRSKGRAGYFLGRHASDDLFSLYQSEKLKESHALAIVSAAPGDANFQRAGVDYARRNPKESAESVGEWVKAAQATPDVAERVATQGDLFGVNDSAIVAMDKARDAALELKKQANADVTTLEAARRKQGALELTDSEALRFGITDRKNVDQISGALTRARITAGAWDRWHLDPDLRRQVFERAKLEVPKLKPAQDQGELLAGSKQDPFNLAGETGVDTVARAEEKAAAEKARQDAKAKFDKEQTSLFASYSKEAPSPERELISSVETAIERAPSEREAEATGRSSGVLTFRRPSGGTVTAMNTKEALTILRDRISPEKAQDSGRLVTMVKHVKELTKNISGVRVRVLRNEADLPRGVRDQLRATDTHEGLVDVNTGDVWLLADHIPSLERATEVLAHEIVGHYGVEKILPRAEWDNIADSIIKESPAMAAEIGARYLKNADVYNWTKGQRYIVAREFVARLAENPNINATLWQRLVVAVQNALRALGLRRSWSEAEIRDLLRRSSQEVQSPATKLIGDDESNIQKSIVMDDEGATEKRAQIGGVEEVGHVYTVRNLSESTERIQGAEFSGRGEVTEASTARAWDLIEELSNPETAATAAARANRITGNDIGAPLLQNELLTYAVKSAQSDGGAMVRHLLGGVNLFATGPGNVSAAGAILRARGEFNHPLWDAYTQIYAAADEVTARILAGKGNEAEGLQLVNAIKSGLTSLQLAPTEILDALEGIRSEGGENLREVLNKLLGVKDGEFNHKNPMLTAIVKLASHAYENGLNFEFKAFTAPVSDGVKEALKPALANIRKTLEQSGADKLERSWWQLLAGRSEDKEGPLSKADRALDAQLGAILKETMKKLGLVNDAEIAKLTDPQKGCSGFGQRRTARRQGKEGGCAGSRGNRWARGGRGRASRKQSNQHRSGESEVSTPARGVGHYNALSIGRAGIGGIAAANAAKRDSQRGSGLESHL